MTRRPTIIFLPDGMADEPMPQLGGRTPLQVACTPAMDALAREGCCGSLLTLPEGYPTSSDVANMTVLGCNLETDYCGRGPLEALGRGIPLGPADTVFRVNFVTLDRDGVLIDFAGGHVDPEPAAALIALLNDRLGSERIRFHPGVSYRNLLVLSGEGFAADVDTDKPDDNQGRPVAAHLPRARSTAAEPTAALLRALMAQAGPLLADSPVVADLIRHGKPAVNGIWPWSGGRMRRWRTMAEACGLRGAVITAVDVIAGIGVNLGMTRIPVPGATGYIDTNYEGKADAAINASAAYDLVYLHVEAIDEVSHARDLARKIMAIEDFDRRVVARVLEAVGDRIDAVVLPDHPVPLRLGAHTRTPVPVAVRRAGTRPDAVRVFDEIACPAGSLGALRNGDLMRLLAAER